MLSIIVHDHYATAHVDLLSEIRISDIGEMRHLSTVSNLRIFDFHKVTDTAMAAHL